MYTVPEKKGNKSKSSKPAQDQPTYSVVDKGKNKNDNNVSWKLYCETVVVVDFDDTIIYNTSDTVVVLLSIACLC